MVTQKYVLSAGVEIFFSKQGIFIIRIVWLMDVNLEIVRVPGKIAGQSTANSLR